MFMATLKHGISASEKHDLKLCADSFEWKTAVKFLGIFFMEL